MNKAAEFSTQSSAASRMRVKLLIWSHALISFSFAASCGGSEMEWSVAQADLSAAASVRIGGIHARCVALGPRGVPTDIGSLIQWVVDAAYLEGGDDLIFYAEKVEYYNEVNEKVLMGASNPRRFWRFYNAWVGSSAAPTEEEVGAGDDLPPPGERASVVAEGRARPASWTPEVLAWKLAAFVVVALRAEGELVDPPRSPEGEISACAMLESVRP